MDANALVLLVLLVLGLSFNGREVIKRGFARVPVLVRSRRSSR
jgi:hypothetical protein